jgi:MSHA pilin protein MshD
MERHAGLASGVSLIELIIAIVIIGIGLTALTATIINTIRHSADPLIQQQANAIAQSYLEEILSQPFCDPNDFSSDCFTDCTASACSACSGGTVTGGGGETRATYDDVCDYEPINEATADINGPIASLSEYTVTVTIDDTGVNFNGLASNSGQVVRIDVDVTHGNGSAVNLSAYKVNF